MCWGCSGLCLWDLLLGRERRVHWCIRIKPSSREAREDGKQWWEAVLCQLADERCKKLPALSPSQSSCRGSSWDLLNWWLL